MSNAITTTVDFSSKKGLAQKVVPSCKDTTGCAWSYSTYTSTMTKNDERSRYDVNIRSIIAFGEIRRGLSHIEPFHRIMNMSPPYSHSTHDDTMKDVLPYYIATMRYYESNGENRTSYWTLQRGSESFCRISANSWSRIQGNRTLKCVERNFMLKKRAMIMSITRITGKGCINYSCLCEVIV